MQEIFEGVIGKILDECANEMFSAEVYNDEFNGTNITNLICLGNVRDILERNIDELKKVPFEAFEKIKERVCEFVHERNGSGSAPCKNQRASCLQLIRVCDLTAIVNQVAEEYVSEINVGENEEFCEWMQDDGATDIYDTECGNSHMFIDGSPSDNKYEYCPYCGKEIKVVE